MSLTQRPTELLQLPLAAGADIPYPERIILSFDNNESIDIGAMCYTKRAKSRKPGRGGRGLPVELDSFDSARVPAVRAAIHYFSDLFAVQGLRRASVHASVSHYRYFLSFAESNGHGDLLTNMSTAKPAFHAYVKYLRHRVSAGTLKSDTATIRQNSALSVLSELAGDDSLHHGVVLCRVVTADRRATEPPPDQELSRVLALCRALFEGLSTFCLENRPYPFGLAVPSYLAIPDDVLWIFPVQRWCMPPHQLAVRDQLKYPHWAFDYENGTVSAVEAIRHRYADKFKAKALVQSAQTQIDASNESATNAHRLNAGFMAYNAFLLLFLANTGMNWAGAAALPWSKEYDISAERQGFRVVKYRAKGKLVSFEIQNAFMSQFKAFLRLREYLLDGKSFEMLFFSRSEHYRNSESQRLKPLDSDGNRLTPIYESLRRIDPNLPIIKSRSFRAAKSDWLLRNADPVTTARVLQNSVATVLQAYAEGSPRIQEEELGGFFNGVCSAVIAKDEEVPNWVQISLGLCSGRGSPQQLGHAPVELDCNSAREGCLFCDKYRVHADDHDIRKLLSCRYCIERTAHLADSEEQFHKLFSPILERIQNLLNEMDRLCPGSVARIASEVESGELDAYWSGKLEMLISLELLI